MARQISEKRLQLAAMAAGLFLVLLGLLGPVRWMPQGNPPTAGSWLQELPANTWMRTALASNGLLLFLLGLSGGRQRSRVDSSPPSGFFTETTERAPTGAYLALGLILVLATGLRFWKLGSDLWFDELVDLINYVRRPLGEILSHSPGFFPHVFFDALARCSIKLFGESALTFRLPAAVFGVLGVGAIFYLGRRLAGTREALLSALLLATSYHHVFFSQDARGYTMQVFFTALATAALVRARFEDTPAA